MSMDEMAASYVIYAMLFMIFLIFCLWAVMVRHQWRLLGLRQPRTAEEHAERNALLKQGAPWDGSDWDGAWCVPVVLFWIVMFLLLVLFFIQPPWMVTVSTYAESLCIILQPYFEFFVFVPMWIGTLLLVVFVGLPYCFYKWVRELTGLQVGAVLKRVWDDGLGAVFAFLFYVGLAWGMLALLQ